MATRPRTPNAMDLLLGTAPRPDMPARKVALDGHAPPALLEETGELLPAETTAPDLPAPIFAPQKSSVADVAGETPAGEPVEATETAGLLAADTVIETVEPELPPAPTKPRRSRKRAPAAPAEAVPAAEVVAAEAAPAGEVVVEVSRPPAKTAGRPRGDPHDAVLEPAYIPIKITVSIPAVVLSELIRTVQTIRRMTGRRQPVNQGTVVAAALEMAFEEFKKKGAASQLVDKLRLE